MLRAMPSPRNSNFARRYIVDRSSPSGAYDSVDGLSDEAALGLLEFLRPRLSEEDLAEFCRKAGLDAGRALDGEGGMPKNGVEKFGQDAVPRALCRARENASRIKVSL